MKSKKVDKMEVEEEVYDPFNANDMTEGEDTIYDPLKNEITT